MFGINKKQSPFRSAHKLSPIYLYEIDLINKATSWISQSANKNSVAMTSKRVYGR